MLISQFPYYIEADTYDRLEFIAISVKTLDSVFQIIPFLVVEIFSLLSVHTIPFDSGEKTNKIHKRDVESIVSSSVVKILPPEIKAKYDEVKSLYTYPRPVQFRWSNNDSFVEDLEDMFASIERELDEILNKTKTSGGFGLNDEFFSFSFSSSESASASKSEEQTAPPEAAETWL